GDRDRQPLRAHLQLVAELVHRLLELEDGEQLVERLLADGDDRLVDRLEVAVEELLPRTLLPAFRRRRSAEDADGGGGVRERTEHPGDVAERRALAAPLRKRSRGLALEVEDDPGVSGPERLAQVEVAVVADRPPRRSGMGQLAQPVA